MAELRIISQMQDEANGLDVRNPLTIRTNQNRGFLDPYRDAAQQARSHGQGLMVAAGTDPMLPVFQDMRQDVRDQSSVNILTTVLKGIRRSGSMTRTASFRGLGAVDCSTIPDEVWKGAQADANMAFLLVNMGRSDFFARAAQTGNVQCYTSWLASQYSNVMPNAETPGIVAALKQAGALSGVSDNDAARVIALFQAAHGLTAKRAVQLFECGVGIDKQDGWGNYATLWAQSACMQSWYENPLYLGIGAAGVIGLVWFATRKKKRS